MDRPYDSFSFNDLFWVQIREHLVSFGFKGLPKDIHLTISFHPDNPKINFHITKNIGDGSSKPKIAIVEVEKNALTHIYEIAGKRMLSLILKPFDMRQFTLQNRNKVGFISYEDIEKGKFSASMEEQLKNTFRPITTFPRKKTRIKIKGDVELQLKTLNNSKQYQKQLQSYIVPVRHIPNGFFVGGMLLSKKELKTVVRIDNKWFEFKFPQTPSVIFNSLLGKEHAKKLLTTYKRALVRVKNANTYQDVAQFDKPFSFYPQRCRGLLSNYKVSYYGK